MSMNCTPDRIRTCDPQLRRLLLYPAELRGHTVYPGRGSNPHSPFGETDFKSVVSTYSTTRAFDYLTASSITMSMILLISLAFNLPYLAS